MYGYNRQSVLKLVVADHVKTNEYVSIDSKIWFVRPTDINKIAQQDRDEYTMDIPTVDEGERLWKLRPKLISNQITPHVMDTKIVSEMLNSFGSINNYCEFFINGVQTTSGPKMIIKCRTWQSFISMTYTAKHITF